MTDDSTNEEPKLSRGEKIRRLHQDPVWEANWRAKVTAGRQKQSPEARSDAAKRSHTPESDAKRAESNKQLWENPEYAAWRTEIFKEANTDEVRAKKSESAKKARQRPEVQAKHAEANAKPEVRSKRKAGSRKRWDRPGESARQSETLQKSWENPSQGQLDSLRALRSKQPLSRLEIPVLKELLARRVPVVVHPPVFKYEMDFFIPHLNLDIECDGRYWHTHPERIVHDAERDVYLTSLGIKIFRLTQAEIEAEDWTRLDAALNQS